MPAELGVMFSGWTDSGELAMSLFFRLQSFHIHGALPCAMHCANVLDYRIKSSGVLFEEGTSGVPF